MAKGASEFAVLGLECLEVVGEFRRIVVAGSKAQAEDLRDRAAAALQPMGLRLSESKTRVAHIDEGFDFLGFRIQRQLKPGTARRYVYVYPTKAAVAAVKAKVRELTQGVTNPSLTDLIRRLNPILRGWSTYFRHACSSRTFSYLRAFIWRRVVLWLRHKHKRVNWEWLRRRYLPGWWPTEDAVSLFNVGGVRIIRYRYRAQRIPSPWIDQATGRTTHVQTA
jgi:RNA-directed DNA polymerase